MNKCRCINCLFYDNVASGKCVLRDKNIDYPYADMRKATISSSITKYQTDKESHSLRKESLFIITA